MTHAPPTRNDVSRGGTRLHPVHITRVRRDGSAEDPPPLDPGAIEPALQKDVVAGWQSLLESEFESVVVAGWMTSALARVGAPLDVLGAFGRVVEDEVRHVDVVAEVLSMLGANPSVPRNATPPVMAWQDDGASDEQVISGLVSFFCVGELISAFEFRHALTLVKLPLARWALGEIHRDEAFHGAFGFETARLFVPHFSDAARARLVARVMDELQRFERRIGGPLLGPPRDLTAREARMAELGLPPAPVMLAVFYATVEQQLVPRMAELGVHLPVRVGSAPG